MHAERTTHSAGLDGAHRPEVQHADSPRVVVPNVPESAVSHVPQTGGRRGSCSWPPSRLVQSMLAEHILANRRGFYAFLVSVILS